jgi:hypothetical protein
MIHVCVCMYASVTFAPVCVCILQYLRTCTYLARIYVYMCVYIHRYIHTHAYDWIIFSIHIARAHTSIIVHEMCLYVHSSVFSCRTRTYVHVCIVHVCMCMHVYMHISMYTFEEGIQHTVALSQEQRAFLSLTICLYRIADTWWVILGNRYHRRCAFSGVGRNSFLEKRRAGQGTLIWHAIIHSDYTVSHCYHSD